MSSTERAPEPTMEEILASIRRIITDDEAGQQAKAQQSSQAQVEDERETGPSLQSAKTLRGAQAPAPRAADGVHCRRRRTIRVDFASPIGRFAGG